MTKMLYNLEDYFDAVAQRKQGSLRGFMSRSLKIIFGFAGDVSRTRA